VTCSGLGSLSSCEEAARGELAECSTEQYGNLQSAASDLLATVAATSNMVNTLESNFADGCDTLQRVCATFMHNWLQNILKSSWNLLHYF